MLCSIWRHHCSTSGWVLAGLLVILVPAAPACAAVVKIGVLAVRAQPQTLARWQPLAAALQQAIPDHDFVIEALSYDEMAVAVASRQLDFVLTDPGQYLLLARRNGLSSPLATLAEAESGKVIYAYGGVIVGRAGPQGITTLAGLRGKTIAVADTESLGGYRMQAYELSQVGIQFPQDARLLITGGPQDSVLQAVLDGRADAGFARSGVIEDLVREGGLDSAQLRIINHQALPGYPLQVSTHLYPDWPLATLPHIDEDLSRRVAAALFLLEENTAATRAMGIHGFVVPADYNAVEGLLREMRLPPFDAMPAFTLHDVWGRYKIAIVIALFFIVLLTVQSIILFLFNLRLSAEKDKVVKQQQQLQALSATLELRVLERTAELQLQNRRNEIILDTTPDGFFSADITGHIRSANPAYCVMLGYAEAELLQLAIADIEARESPQDVADHIEQLKVRGYDRFDTRHRRKDGSVVEVEISVSLADVDGEKLFYVFARDITSRKEAEAALIHARDVAERASQVKSDFLSRMSHELRTPMNAILGFTQLLELEQLPPRQLDHVHEIHRASDHLLELINELLDLSRIEAGKMVMVLQPTPVQAVVTDAVQIVRSLISDRQLALSIDCTGPAAVLADPTRLKQILVNLLSNAAKYNHHGGRIALGCQQLDGARLRLSVTDSGPGIAAEHQARLFKPFERLGAEFSAVGGTGIGLALSRQLAELMGATLGFHSRPGQGSTFWVELPLA
ncbi:MAG: PhnD/SsuA/transferrin family substrate-binding protein [Gammaproteobacteria bacterium]|nr:PhnD/SsuA/transferrin family substrate-binding protein [Gammaproteobacteria bacterium]